MLTPDSIAKHLDFFSWFSSERAWIGINEYYKREVMTNREIPSEEKLRWVAAIATLDSKHATVIQKWERFSPEQQNQIINGWNEELVYYYY